MSVRAAVSSRILPAAVGVALPLFAISAVLLLAVSARAQEPDAGLGLIGGGDELYGAAPSADWCKSARLMALELPDSCANPSTTDSGHVSALIDNGRLCKPPSPDSDQEGVPCADLAQDALADWPTDSSAKADAGGEQPFGGGPSYGGYDVWVCASAYGYANNAMSGWENNANMWEYDGCGDPNLRTLGAGAGDPVSYPQGSVGYLQAWAPGGTKIVGYSASMDCDGMYGWSAGAYALQMDQNLVGVDSPNYCQVGYPGGTTGDRRVSFGTWLCNPDTSGCGYAALMIGARCEYAGTCYFGGGGFGQANANDIAINLQDLYGPSIGNPHGSLWTDSWLTGGSQTAYFDVHDDGGGLQTNRLFVDGGQGFQGNYPCNFTYMQPCPRDDVGMYQTVNVDSLSDGAHTITARIEDVGGNRNELSKTIYVDRTAPSAPQQLDVTPSGWTATNDFKVDFDNPGGQVSPIDGVRYKIGSPPTSKTDGTAVDLADGSPTGTVSDLHAGGVGDTPVYLWLYDKAGNTSEVNRATGSLKFDDTAPKEAKPDIANGWIGKAEADGYVQTWFLPIDPLPQSGISGYATSLDRDKNGNPGIVVTDPESPREKILNINEEGSWWFHVRAISGAGVAGPVDKTELKIDLTAPSSEISGVPGSEWVNHDVTLTLSGSDALSGVDPSQAGSGTFYKIDDGSFQQGASIGLSADGKHTVTYHATDVAGNAEADKAVKVGIDKTAPTVAFVASEDSNRPAVLHAVVADGLSGIADATISYRTAGSGDSFTALPTSVSGSTAETVFPDDEVEAGTYELKISAHDVAGNLAESQLRETGEAMVLQAPLRDATKIDAGFATKATKLKSRCRKRTSKAKRSNKKLKRRCKANAPVLTGLATGVKTAFGKGAPIRGVIYDSSERPIRGAPLAVYVKQDIPGAEWQEAHRLKADAQGAFAVSIPAGYSRIVRIRYEGTELRRSAESKDLALKVQAKVTFSVWPKRLKNGQLMRFKGGVKLNPGAHLPPGGKLVALEFLDQRGGKRGWKVAGKVLRTDSRGVIKGRYRFRHVSYTQRIIFGLDVLREETFPYIPGRSKPRSVTVRP